MPRSLFVSDQYFTRKHFDRLRKEDSNHPPRPTVSKDTDLDLERKLKSGGLVVVPMKGIGGRQSVTEPGSRKISLKWH